MGPSARPAPAAPTSDVTADPLPPGLPSGLVELAMTRWREATSRAERAGLRLPACNDRHLSARVIAELTAPLRLEDWPAPTEPRPAGTGWIHDEVIDADRDLLDAILADGHRWPAERVARAAQEMRLPVTPYRTIAAQPDEEATTDHPEPTSASNEPRPQASRRPGPPLVVDLTTHWAGPLATSLLAEAGAEVIKVDPGCRPDGFRERPALYHHLNQAKRIVDLDLRQPSDRADFERLVVDADLLVESFSRRVLPNLGYGPEAIRRLNPGLATLSIKAFPSDRPERDWLAYGPGVHAAVGLGMTTGRPTPAPVAYPDLIAGLTAAARAFGLLADGGGRAEVSLAGSIDDLVHRAEAERRAGERQADDV